MTLKKILHKKKEKRRERCFTGAVLVYIYILCNRGVINKVFFFENNII